MARKSDVRTDCLMLLTRHNRSAHGAGFLLNRTTLAAIVLNLHVQFGVNKHKRCVWAHFITLRLIARPRSFRAAWRPLMCGQLSRGSEPMAFIRSRSGSLAARRKPG